MAPGLCTGPDVVCDPGSPASWLLRRGMGAIVGASLLAIHAGVSISTGRWNAHQSFRSSWTGVTSWPFLRTWAYLLTDRRHPEPRSGLHELAAGTAVGLRDAYASRAAQVFSLAWVVMPDHLHWLIELGPQPLAPLMQRLKSRSAIAINGAAGRNGKRLWQKGFHDHALRNDEDLKGLARYIVANPMRAGLVRRIGDYPLWDAVWL